MAELGSYYITIMPSMKGFTSKVNKELGGLGSAGGKSFSTSFIDVIKGSAIGTALGNLASKAGSAISDGLKTGIERLDTLSNYPKVMENLGYTAEEADKSIKTISEHLVGLPSSTDEIVRLTQSIADSTDDLGLATDAALGFSDMLTAAGASSSEVATATDVFNRVLGKQSATVQQWQSLCSVMPAELNMVGEYMLGAGKNSQDLYEALENGTVSWQDFLKAIAELDKSGYIDSAGNKIASTEQRARDMSAGIGTAIHNITNRVGKGWAAILEVVGQENISTAINKTSDSVANVMIGIANHLNQLKQRLADLGTFEKFQTVIGMIRDKFGQFGETVKGAVDQAIPVIANLIDKGLQWIIDHGESIGRFIDTIAGAFGKVAEVVGGALSKAMPVIGGLVDKALTWILDHGEVVAGILAALAAKMVFKGVVDGARGIIDITNSLKVMSEVLPMVERVGDLPAMFGLVSEAGGPLAGIFGKLGQSGEGLGTAIGAIKNVVPSVTSAFGAMGGSAGGLGGALSALATGPVGIIVAAIAGLALAFKTLYDTNENFRNTVNEVWEGIASKVKEAMDRIGEALKPIAEAMGIQVGDMKSGFEVIVAVVKTFWETISNALGPSFVSLVTSAAAVIKGIVDVVVGVFEVIGGVIRGFKDGDWSMFVDGLKSIWDGFWSVVTAPVQGAIAAIKYTLEEMGYKWEEVVGYWRGIWNGFVGALGSGWEGAKGAVMQFCADVSGAWGNLKTNASTIFGKIKGDIKTNMDAADAAGEKAGSALQAALKGDWDTAASDAYAAYQSIAGCIGDKIGLAADFVRDGGNTIGDILGFPGLGDNVASVFDGIRQFIEDPIGVASDFINENAERIVGIFEFAGLADTVSSIFDGIRSFIEDPIGAARDFCEGIIRDIENLFSGMSINIPSFPLPHIEWHWESVGDVLNVPIFDGINWYKRGGVFDSAALIGIGEAGKEAALPLNRKTYGEIAHGIMGEMDGGAGGVIITGNTFYVREEADIDRVADALARKWRREEMGRL